MAEAEVPRPEEFCQLRNDGGLSAMDTDAAAVARPRSERPAPHQRTGVITDPAEQQTLSSRHEPSLPELFSPRQQPALRNPRQQSI